MPYVAKCYFWCNTLLLHCFVNIVCIICGGEPSNMNKYNVLRYVFIVIVNF